MKIMAPPSKSFMHCCTQCPQPWSRPPPTHASSRDSWIFTGKSGSSLVESMVLYPGSWCIQGFACALQESVSPVLHKFWQLYDEVNGNLLQEGLCHTQVCCTQSPYPCSRPVLTCTSTEDTQTQFWLTLSGVSGSWCIQGLFEPSECLWKVWGLILKAMSPLLPSCLGLSLDPTFSCWQLFSSEL